MKTRIRYLLLLFLLFVNGLIAQNVSTGLDPVYAPTPVGGLDSWWQITAGPSGAASAYPISALREATYGTFWQPTPMSSTNACWIDATGSNVSTLGDYTFERTFTVSPFDASIVADFGMGWDDLLLSAELVPPSGPIIPLTVPIGTPNQYWVGPSVNHTVTSPVAGIWKIRVVVRFVDSVGGFILSGEVKHCPKLIISTGVDHTGTAVAVGAVDPDWIISAGPGGSVTHRVASFSDWQSDPVSSTNACWINSTGTYNDPVGIETFDRDFVIPSGISSFTTAFGVAWDGELLSLELVPPSGPAIPLTVPGAPPYTVSPNIDYTVSSPVPGTWKVRAKVQFTDQLGGFILSGQISIPCSFAPPLPCDCSSLNADFDYVLNADCSGHFVGSTQSTCFSDVKYEWSVDGSMVGAGQIFDYPFTTNGAHIVCLRVRTILADGQECVKEICKTVDVQCSPCNCQGLVADMKVLLDACHGNFQAIAQGNSCMQNFGYEWSVNGAVVGTGPVMAFNFPGAGMYVVCLRVTTILADGQECEQKVCKDVKVDNCTSCDCSSLNADFDYALNADCSGHFVGSSIQSSCFIDVKYEWSVDGSIVGTGQIFDYPFTTNGTHVVCLKITTTLSDGQQCEQQICKDVQVQCSPCNCEGLVADMNVLMDACHGNFQAIVQGNSCMQKFGYEWTVNGAVVGTGPVMAFNFPGAGMYVVCLKVTSTLPNGTVCEKKVCKDVKVDNCTSCNCSSLNADFDYVLNADCSGHFIGSTQSTCFIDAEYEWSVDGSVVGTGQIFDYPFTTNGTHVVCLKITTTLSDGQQCEQQICKDVQVQCSPCNCEGLVADMNVLMDACHGNFQAIVQGNSCMQKFGYEWTVNGAVVGTGPVMAFNFPGNGMYVVCLKVTSTLPNGTVCEKKVCKDVKVDNCTSCNCSSLNADFDYALNADCSGHFVGSSIQSSCFIDVKYEWSVDGSVVGTGQIFDYPFTTNGTHVVCLKITTTLSDGQQCEQQICKDVQVQCSPCNCEGLVADMNVLMDACHGNFQAIVQGNSCMQKFGYEWTVNGVVVGTGPVMAFNFPGNGMYVVCLKVTSTLPNGTVCEKKVCKDIKVDNCTSCNCSSLNADFGYILNADCSGHFVGSTQSACFNCVAYVWSVDGSMVGTGQIFDYLFTTNGAHIVCLKIVTLLADGQICEQQICKDVIVDCGITQSFPDDNTPVNLYPNPAADELNVEFTTLKSGEATVKLKTIDGKEIMHETRITEAGAQHFRLTIPAFVAAEVIMVEIDNGAKHIVRKVTISKH